MKEPIHIISLGAGVQSSAMALMAAKGEIKPMPTAAIFADTQDEPKKVYEWLEYLSPKLPFPVLHVTNGSVMDDGLPVYTSAKSGKTYIKSIIPAFTLQKDGTKGLLGRKCTADYKIKVIIAKIRELVTPPRIREWRKKHAIACKQIGVWKRECKRIKDFNKGKPKHERKLSPHRPEAAWKECQQDALAVSWIGISTDEASRVKESREIWIRSEWPLLDKWKSRDSCLDWMKNHGHPEPPRSACIKCPFHSDDEWIDMRDNQPEEFDEACTYEEKLQDAARRQTALTGTPFLHDTCVPLRQVKFVKTATGYKQVSLFGNECEGMCGV